jgi:hypothetical protein
MAPRLDVSKLYDNPFQSIIDGIRTDDNIKRDFSRLDRKTLELLLKNATVEGTKTKELHKWVRNYNLMLLMIPTLGCECGRNM